MGGLRNWGPTNLTCKLCICWEERIWEPTLTGEPLCPLGHLSGIKDEKLLKDFRELKISQDFNRFIIFYFSLSFKLLDDLI